MNTLRLWYQRSFLAHWNTPVTNGLHALAFSVNAMAGVFNLFARHWLVAVLNFTVGGGVIGMNVALGLSRRRLDRNLEHVRMRLLELQGDPVSSEEMEIAHARADRNLAAVLKSTGAEYINGCCVLRVGGIRFRIQPNEIIRINEQNQYEQTCYQSMPMPRAEKMASAILLLKRDPSLFDKWKNYHGTPFL